MEQDLESVFRLGQSLTIIRDEKLWQEAHSANFVAYLKERWGYSKRYAYNLIEASEIRNYLPKLKTAPGVQSGQDSPEWTERTVRPLSRLKVEVPGENGATKKVVSPGMIQKGR